jgi:hypothetical protein
VGCSDKKERVLACFNDYKNAVLQRDGEKAVGFLSNSTLRYYDNVVSLVVHSDSAALAKTQLSLRFAVLSIRHRFKRQEYLGIDGKGLLQLYIEKEMFSEEIVPFSTVTDVVVLGGSINEKAALSAVTDISVSGDHATARLVLDGEKTDFLYDFVYEGDAWKLDLVPTIAAANEELSDVVHVSGVDENGWIFDRLKVLSGVRPTGAIWRPVGD